MALEVVDHADDRYEDRLATTRDGFVSAADRNLTRWTVDPLAAGDPVVAGESLPGPLVVLDEHRLGWGPVVLDNGTAGASAVGTIAPLVAAALSDLGEGAVRQFRLTAGAVNERGDRCLVVLEQQGSRAVASRAREPAGPPVRVAIVEATTASLVEVVTDEDPAPTSVLWGAGPLRLGLRGHVVEPESDRRLDVGDTVAVRSLAGAGADHPLAAGTAGGRVAVFDTSGRSTANWTAHDGPVLTMAWTQDGSALVTGGQDGRIELWDPSGVTIEGAAFDAPVSAVTWVDGDRIAAKVGGPGGRIVLLARQATER